MKITKTFALATLVSLCVSTALAENKFVFGVYGGASIMESSMDYYDTQGFDIDAIEGDKQHTGYAYNAKIGGDIALAEQQWLRIYADYTGTGFSADKQNFVNKILLHHIGLNIDYKYDFTNGFYLSAGGGLVHSSGKIVKNISQIGFALNVAAGYSLTSFLDLELKGKVFASDYLNNYSVPKTITDTRVSTQTLDVDTPVAIMLGLNFRF